MPKSDSSFDRPQPVGVGPAGEPSPPGHRFSFFQAVRLIEALNPGAARIGGAGPTDEEGIRFSADVSLEFPRTDVVRMERPGGEAPGLDRYHLVVSFLSLFGTFSPLPLFYTEAVSERDDPDSARVRDFADVFHHRLVSLFYRAWTKYNHAVQYQPGGADGFTRRLLPLTGDPPDTGRDPAQKVSLIRYLGLLTNLPRSAAGLKRLLADYWDGLKVEVTQYVGRWVTLKDSQRCALGRRNSELGVNCLAGRRVRDRQGKFRVTLGPVGFKQYLEFLPSSSAYRTLLDLVRLYLIDPLDFDVEVVLRGDEVSAPPLGSRCSQLSGLDDLPHRPARPGRLRGTQGQRLTPSGR